MLLTAIIPTKIMSGMLTQALTAAASRELVGAVADLYGGWPATPRAMELILPG